MIKQQKGADQNCIYYPCHKDLEDCTFCYCPYYPCEDISKGDYIISGEFKIWNCMQCTWIHQSKVVKDIYNRINNMKSKGVNDGS